MKRELTMQELDKLVDSLTMGQCGDGVWRLPTDMTHEQAEEAQAYLEWVLAGKPLVP